MLTTLSPRVVVAAMMLVVALATIAGAWAFELIGGFVPCKLCRQERIPYYVGIPMLALAIATTLAPVPDAVTRSLLGAAALVFAASAGLGLYHAGVEWSWWAGPSDCGAGGGAAATTAQELLDQLDNIRIVSCSEASWRFPSGWGLSFAGWNALISADLAAGGLFAAIARWPSIAATGGGR